MRASVIIPSRGGADRLPRLLANLADQTHTDWHAVVVLDGDIDNSAQVVAGFDHLPVSTIVFAENRGRVAALNAGFAAADGQVLIRADDDFELQPGHIAAHVAAHREQPCGVIGLPHNVAPDNAYMRAYGRWADEAGRTSARSFPADQRWRLFGGNVSVTREVYDQVGGYDPRYQGYGWEDVDFGYRVQQLALPLVIADGARVTHHMASVTTEIRAQRAWHSGAARAVFEQIHGLGSSGPVEPKGPGVWNRAVRVWARALTPHRLRTTTRAIDRVLPVLPTAMGRKAVALSVESASVAGFQWRQ